MPTDNFFCMQLKGSSRFLRLFGDSKKAKGLRSGYVTLKPKESVGQHNTGPSEEVIFIISGSGVVRYGLKGKIKIKKNSFIYIPPGLAHNVINTGKKRLKYLYTAARIKGQ